MNGFENPTVYSIEQLRGYFERYHTTGKHGRTRMDRCGLDGYAARIQTEDAKLRHELEGAGFTTKVTGNEGREFLVATLDEPLATDYDRDLEDDVQEADP